MVQYTEGSFVNARSQKIFTVSYLPDSGQVSGVLYFHHGLGEYCGRYKEVFTRIVTEANVAVYSFDRHGHGKSEPKEEKGRCYFDKYEDIVDDSSQYLDTVLPKHPGVPWICGGQSLGGLDSVHLVLRRQKDFAGLVLHSAAIDVEWTPVLRCQAVLGDCISACCPFAKIVPAVRPRDMNPDPKMVEEFINDPDIYQSNVKARSGNVILKAFKSATQRQKQITVPIYACHGTSDKCTSLPAVKRLVKAAASTDKTVNEIKGGYHELFHGPEKDEVISTLIAWIKAHVSGAGPIAAEDVKAAV